MLKKHMAEGPLLEAQVRVCYIVVRVRDTAAGGAGLAVVSGQWLAQVRGIGVARAKAPTPSPTHTNR
jgi:hypothetical protein